MPTHDQQEQPTIRPLVRQTGLAVAVLGVAELVLGFANAPPATFKLDLLGLVVAAAILAGPTRLLIVVRWLALLGCGGVLLQFPGLLLFMPGDLLLTQVRLHPWASVIGYAQLLVGVLIAFVPAAGLSRRAVLDAWAAQGRKGLGWRLPLVLGLVFAAGAGALNYRMLNGEDARAASRMAAQRHGTGYRYVTTSIHVSFGDKAWVTAAVQAWNDREIRLIPVRWQRAR